MKKGLFKFIAIVVIVLFIALYVGQYTGYYDFSTNRKTTLTNDAIKRFEDDLANGKKINASDYLVEEKNYSNNLSRLGIKTSKLVEKSFNKAIRTIFNEIEKVME